MQEGEGNRVKGAAKSPRATHKQGERALDYKAMTDRRGFGKSAGWLSLFLQAARTAAPAAGTTEPWTAAGCWAERFVLGQLVRRKRCLDANVKRGPIRRQLAGDRANLGG